MKKVKYIVGCFLLLTCFSCASLYTRRVNLPDDLIYNYRLLLIFTPRQDLPVYQQEEEMYVNQVEGLAARDVKVYRLFPRSGLNPDNRQLNSAQVFTLRNEYQVADNEFVNILVDKDGEEKFRKKGILPPRDLFAIIDTLYVE
jgi:hypothetical protein